ncbi:hypothetical protein [Streptosporangium carneum]|uniref:Uncharacterized protein n=1 Tax=Streptosporangium carneum TaxID=47481 RepID=A0A9W6HYI0_9ACTN|nr:hypothetical protein [Streptosporangium carneum]GLK08373.1 hypothetical protein GCM10017600_17780 [Streptosporangium carneum]
MWRRFRAPGVHGDGRIGSPAPTAPHRLWDSQSRAEAERLTRVWKDWTVLYGPGSRRFYAVAAWPTPDPLVVEDRTPEGLEIRIREAEAAVVTRRAEGDAAPDTPPAP